MSSSKSNKEDVEVTRVSFNEMTAENTERAVGLIKEVMVRAKKGELRTASEIARAIKSAMESKMGGGAWHVIVGEHFGSFVSHETGKILYLFFQKLGVLCWSHG